MGRWAVPQAPQAVTAAVPLSRITTVSGLSTSVSEIRLYATGGTVDQLVHFQLVTYSTDGAGGATPTVVDTTGQGGTFGGTATVYDGSWSTAPTVSAVLDTFAYNFSSGIFLYQPKPADEQGIASATRFGLHVASAPGSSITLGSSVRFYELR